MGARMGIPLAHCKSESYLDANIANNRKIIGNVRTIFGNHKVIVRGLVLQIINIRIFYDSPVAIWIIYKIMVLPFTYFVL